MSYGSWRLAGAIGAALALGVGAPAAGAAGLQDAPEVRDVGPELRAGKLPALTGPIVLPDAVRAQGGEPDPDGAPVVGTVKVWPTIDFVSNQLAFPEFTLRALGRNIEVWVQNDVQFPAGDCRNGARTVVTDEQARYLAREFDENMYPKESAAFSVPPARTGANAYSDEELPAGYWGGQGEDIVALIYNVRDENYYDPDNSQGHSYVAGFFSGGLNEFLDRNVMTIDAFDWLHRTGANPPNEPVPGDLCASAPARPFLYEGTFAHEYQHLLEYYEDGDEVNWVNEGLSDWAQTLTGYVDPRPPITDQDFDSHIQCFLGYLGIQTPANPNPRATGGPENSLTLWGDQGDDEILCDYGAAYTMMEFLHGRYGTDFMTALHRGDENGFAGLEAALRSQGSRDTAASILRDWSAMVALDGVLDSGVRFFGRSPSRLRAPTLNATVNWDTPEAYSEPGAPPNGSDYVRLRDAGGKYLSVRRLTSLEFDGAETTAEGVEWTVDPSPVGQEGDPALAAGSGGNLDRSIVRQVDVPAANTTLSFETRWDLEEGWDYAFVQVSTDGGETYTSLANADTTTTHDPDADPRVVAQLPGFTGTSGGWRTETFDLSAYAGQSILLAFRTVTDANVNLPGWWIDDVTVGGTLISDGSSLEGWRSMSEIRPTPVAGYTVQVVGYSSSSLAGRRGGVAFVRELTLDDQNRGRWTHRQVRRLLNGAHKADVVAVIVTHNDPTESVGTYARYTLKANAVTQPGG